VQTSASVEVVELRGPSDRGEGTWVLRASAAVAMLSLLCIARVGPQARAAPQLAPYQVRYVDLAPAERRIAAELREGLAEAERVRIQTGAWPSAAALAADGVPPFAADPLAPGLRWSMRREGLTVNYLGESTGDGPAYLIVVQEPMPGAGDPPGTPPDEIHHVLPDGTVLHVYSCVRDRAPADAVVTGAPWLTGWKQIVVETAATQEKHR